jgi:hypothetical protein
MRTAAYPGERQQNGQLSVSVARREWQRVKYWIDTEFIERPYTIDLISVGLVAEDGREFYAGSNEVDWSKANQWTLLNVRPHLDGQGMRREEIGNAVRRFCDGDEHPVFWGYFPAYDWVAFSWLFGSMDELPFHYPQLCLDIKQWGIELGEPEMPHQLGAKHHALLDARCFQNMTDIALKAIYDYLSSIPSLPDGGTAPCAPPPPP